jgi:hypothetical protein
MRRRAMKEAAIQDNLNGGFPFSARDCGNRRGLGAVEVLRGGEEGFRTGDKRGMSEQKQPHIVIADLDGTIALIERRRHWLNKDQHPELTSDERWRNFFAACPKDRPNIPVIRTLRALRWSWYDIHIFSGRSDEVQDQTLTWLDKFNVPFQLLKMRPAGDFTPDEELKRQWIQEYDLAQILCVFDDRQKVVDMWRELGLTCFQVAPGDF